jgi:hypothetical protein
MKRLLQSAVFTLCAAALSQGAAVPVRDMTPFTLGAEYLGMLHGHEGLYDFDSSALGAHFLRLHYAPLPYLRFSAGLGGSHSYAGPFIRGSRAGAAAAGGAGFYAPELFNYFTFTAGYDGYYLKASEKLAVYGSYFAPRFDSEGAQVGGDTISYISYSRDGRTAAALHAPYAGVIVSIGRFFGIEVGGLYQYFEIIKRSRAVAGGAPGGDGGVADGVAVFEEIKGMVQGQVRLYAAAAIRERESGAYLAGGLSYAITDAVEGKGRLNNLSFWAQVGLLMKDPRGAPRYGGPGGGYAELKRRQDRMAAELSAEAPQAEAPVAADSSAAPETRAARSRPQE